MFVYENGLIQEGDQLVEKYVSELQSVGFPGEAMKLISIMTEKTEKSFSEIMTFSLDFTQKLASTSNVEKAREFIDSMIQRISSDPKLSTEKNQLNALLSKKFAFFVAHDNPDLASEYAYLASDFLRGVNDFPGIVEIYTNLSTLYTTPKRVIRTLKRGIYICKMGQRRFNSFLQIDWV